MLTFLTFRFCIPCPWGEFLSDQMARLLLWRCPSTIGWFVISIIVYSVECFSEWPLSHILKKCLKGLPSFTNFYFLFKISFGVFTSVKQASPRVVCWAKRGTMTVFDCNSVTFFKGGSRGVTFFNSSIFFSFYNHELPTTDKSYNCQLVGA